MSKNTLQFGGNVTKAPETKTFKTSTGEKSYTSVTVAMNHPRKQDTKALFIEVKFFDKFSAEVAGKLAKGERIYVEGELSWNLSSQGMLFYSLESASFAPGWLPPRKDGAEGAPGPAASSASSSQEGDSDELPF